MFKESEKGLKKTPGGYFSQVISTRSLIPRGGEAKAPIPPLDNPMDQLLRPSLEKEKMIAQVPSHNKLNTEDKTPHN
jgi:hypothetical protein